MLGQPITMLIPGSSRLQADRRAARGHHRHGSGTDGYPVAASQRGGRQICGVLRPRTGPTAAGRPCHHRQYGAGIRRHLRHLPHRPGNPGYLRLTGRADELSHWWKPMHAHRACSMRQHPRGRVQRGAGAGPGQRGAQPGRTQTPPGPYRLREAKQATEKHLHQYQAEREGQPTKRQDIARLEDEGGTTAIGAEESHHGGCVTVDYHDASSCYRTALWSSPPSPVAPTPPIPASIMARRPAGPEGRGQRACA